MNTTDFLSISNAICPDSALMVFDGAKWNYARTWDRVNRLANGLRGLGIRKGDRSVEERRVNHCRRDHGILQGQIGRIQEAEVGRFHRPPTPQSDGKGPEERTEQPSSISREVLKSVD
jgi:hypothetical protein